MTDKKERLALGVIDFLTESLQDGTIKEEDKDGLEIAVQSIAEAYGIDLNDQQQRARLSIKPASLMSIFDLYLKTRDRIATSASVPPTPQVVSPETKAQAEKLKQTGNTQMSRKEYTKAIESYTQAIALDGANAVYYSNRAAAYSSLGEHNKAISDSEKALELDPKFVKAFSRLGHAHFCLEDYVASASAFRRGLELDPNNSNFKAGLEQAEARMSNDTAVSLEEDTSNAPTSGGLPDLSSLASMLGGGGGGGNGGGGGMPDIAGMLSNPAVRQMAQNLMANGGMERLMQNPALANMMNRAQSGGGMPSMQELMSDPSLRELRNTFGMRATTPAQAKCTPSHNKIANTQPSSTRMTRAASKTKAPNEVRSIPVPVKHSIQQSRTLHSTDTLDTSQIKVNHVRSENVEGDENIEQQPIKAFLRIRPNNSEGIHTSNPYLVALSGTAVQMIDPSPSTSRLRNATTQSIYTFTKVFLPETRQSEFFVNTGLPPIRDLFNGQNGLLFTYGVTNSGKTYTIQGGINKGSAGLLPRTLDVIFNSLEGLHSEAPLRPIRLAGIEYDNDDNESASSSLTAVDLSSNANESVLADVIANHPDWDDHDDTIVQVDRTYEYSVWVSYFEIYNEKIFDLLNASTLDSSGTASLHPPHYNGPVGPNNTGFSGGMSTSNSDAFMVKRKALALKSDPNGGKYIANLREIKVRSVEEAKAIVKLGQVNRKVFGTLANQTSSRSHGIFTIKIVKSKGNAPDVNDVYVSRLALVDLAGSERANNTQNSGERLKEAGNINKSLMVLGQCMEALRTNQKKLASASSPQNVRLNVVPFRHSKLTEIFQDFFVGNGKAPLNAEFDMKAMIVNVNPYDTGFDENSRVMKFSALAKDINTLTQKRPPPSSIPRFTPQTSYRKVTLSIDGKSGVKVTEKQFDIVEEEEDQDDLDSEPNNPLIEALFERVEELRIRLYEAEMRCALSESEVREEVTREMEERMSRMEKMYASRIRNELEENQLKIDRKIDMLRQAGFVTAGNNPVDGSLSDIDEEIDIERSLARLFCNETLRQTMQTDSDESSRISMDGYDSSPLAKKGRQPSHIIIMEDSSSDIGLFVPPEDEVTPDCLSSAVQGGVNKCLEEQKGADDSIPQSWSLTTEGGDIESSIDEGTSSAPYETPTAPNSPSTSVKAQSLEEQDILNTVTKQRVSFDSLLQRKDDPVVVIPDKQARKKSIIYAGLGAEYVPRDGEIDIVPKKKKRILGKKTVLTATEIEAFAVKADDSKGGTVRRLTRTRKAS
ncbi:hypothetical protein Clacol_003760 [Clathrus columnatus]|uniref:Kinesin motor domain-containing protein n=1 Tax=Clathrus columnatus TaxID=1419009 RepID=A0AAV5A7Q1_9AGAM|nr:hypothetical protein Clacol_003760 [Clathrus columnatus]